MGQAPRRPRHWPKRHRRRRGPNRRTGPFFCTHKGTEQERNGLSENHLAMVSLHFPNHDRVCRTENRPSFGHQNASNRRGPGISSFPLWLELVNLLTRNIRPVCLFWPHGAATRAAVAPPKLSAERGKNPGDEAFRPQAWCGLFTGRVRTFCEHRLPGVPLISMGCGSYPADSLPTEQILRIQLSSLVAARQRVPHFPLTPIRSRMSKHGTGARHSDDPRKASSS